MNIVVLAGGYSPERDVSLSSGSLIANALMDRGHGVLLLDLYVGMDKPPHCRDLFRKSGSTKYRYTVPEKPPDLAALLCRYPNNGALIGSHVLEICREADLVFLALHGSAGENGQLQALFDMYGIRYTGTGYIGSLLAMDKDLSKRLMRAAEIPTPDWILWDPYNDGEPPIVQIPCVVKPCSCGSSVGVTIVKNRTQLKEALQAAAEYGETILIESMASGREFSAGILNGVALPVIEIIPGAEFYDYETKYQKGRAQELCPAPINAETAVEIQRTALLVHRTLRLGSYSRIDFILDCVSGLQCLEANTLPGMTPTSLLPREAAAAGIGYCELCERIAGSAFA